MRGSLKQGEIVQKLGTETIDGLTRADAGGNGDAQDVVLASELLDC
ncbi:MAG: hypothetical protein PHI23_00560 [Candidatus Peribacteraceae bacterium]|nr:hypothetical protein [Candidatus Peribacteraceae bacterium]